MSNSLIIADELGDLEALAGPYQMMSTRDYVSRPAVFGARNVRVVNLSRSYGYQSLGYYASLLAEARGHRVLPAVETALDLTNRDGYAHALPELQAALERDLAKAGAELPAELNIYLGDADDPRFSGFARLVFDWFRAPVLAVTLALATKSRNNAADVAESAPLTIARISLRTFARLNEAQKAQFATVLAAQSKGVWRSPKPRTQARYSIAVLHDPQEAMPPSSVSTLKHWARIAERLGVEVEPIQRRDVARLAQFDALFIRETTSIRNHTYRFAQRARAEGMPVIDDPVSMIRCTNKIYLWERLQQAGVATPLTRVVRKGASMEPVAQELGFPLVLKVPDGSFSRGVRKAANAQELKEISDSFFADSALVLAQQYLPTSFDWRVGVLDGEPLYVCQYRMARNHWQIVNHRPDGKAVEGGFKTMALAEAPPEVVDLAVRASRLIGDGLYGVDLKQTDEGVVVIEINDNPNLDHGIEDAVSRDELWTRLTGWFTSRLRR